MAKDEKLDVYSSPEFKRIVESIDSEEKTEWERHIEGVSCGINAEVFGYFKAKFKLQSTIENNFLDYVNAVKSLLITYNFGDVNQKTIEEQKPDIFAAIEKILSYVLYEKDGVPALNLDLKPYVSQDDYNDMFSFEENGKPRVAYVTHTACIILTTLVFFRRSFAIGNEGERIFLEDEEYAKLDARLVEVVTRILRLFYDYVNPEQDQRGFEPFSGWGFTLSHRFSNSTTLNDTYEVVDAITKFDDAFKISDGKDEIRDKEFVKRIENKYHDILIAVGKEPAEADSKAARFLDDIVNSAYKVSLNVYDRVKGVYGKDVFYEEKSRDGKTGNISYLYKPIALDQISASSSRSSALFNPLYVAMITLNGYCEKEVVINEFINNPDKIDEYFKNDDSFEADFKDFAVKVKGYYDSDEAVDNALAKFLEERKEDRVSYDSNWEERYLFAKRFRRFLDERHQDLLHKIPQYRDYLNATKDAILLVQRLYRDFGIKQRLGVIDTDYLLFTNLDILRDNYAEINISKLNKANIAVNNIRPLLLSSQILIVKALSKYPTAEIKELYEEILDKKYKGRKRYTNDNRIEPFIWNEDIIDMNSTAKHCDAILYDYYDYYEKFELGLRTLQNLKEAAKKFSNEDKFDADLKLRVGRVENEFKQLVLNLTKLNVDRAKERYDKKYQEQDAEIKQKEGENKEILQQHSDAIAEKNKEIECIKKEKQQAIDDLRASRTFQLGKKFEDILFDSFINTFREILTVEAIRATNFEEAALDINKIKNDEVNIHSPEGVVEKEEIERIIKAIKDSNIDAEKVALYKRLILLLNFDSDGALALGARNRISTICGSSTIEEEKKDVKITDAYFSILDELKELLDKSKAKDNNQNSDNNGQGEE